MKYHLVSNDDGEPMVHVELSAPEVQTIFSALSAAAREHRARIHRAANSNDLVHERAIEAVAEYGAAVQKWSDLDDELGAVWWPWVDSFDLGEGDGDE